MPRKKSANPTDGELAILRVLWDCGPSTVRQVHAAINEESETGYTTTLKIMQIMTEKGLVSRDESERTHIYQAAANESEVQKNLADDLLEKAFGGNTAGLVQCLAEHGRIKSSDIERLRKILKGKGE